MLKDASMAQRKWGAVIQGDAPDLADWASSLKPPFDPWIELYDNETILRSSSLDGLSTAGEVRDRCVAYIERLNGAVALDRGSKPVRFGSAVEIGSNGVLHRTLFVEAGQFKLSGKPVTMRIVTFGQDGKPLTPPPQPSAVQAWAELAEEDELLEDALVYFGRSTDWFDIYKALECLIMRAGGEEEFLALGWAQKTQIKRLKQTANSARHARKKYDPPENPMGSEEAHSLVGDLLRRAFDEAGKPNPNAV
jgi:hypothetical protein